MSHREARALSAELEAISASLQALQIRVEGFEERLQSFLRREESRVEEDTRSSRSPGASVADLSSISRGSYSQVSSVAIDPTSDSARTALAREIGQFIARCLRGDIRGTSGRDRLRLQNRLYVVAADYNGQRFNPPLVVDRFSEVRALCKRESDCGQSIFIGLPSKWEAKVVVQEAGLELPSRLLDGF